MNAFFKKAFFLSLFSSWYYTILTKFTYHFSFKKKFARIEGIPLSLGLWHVTVNGPGISLGSNAIIQGTRDSKTRLTSLNPGGVQGAIEIGNNVLIMNGVRIYSAANVVIGDDCMIASFCSISDADWHGFPHPERSPGNPEPVVLERGVWLGDSALVCKGVRIGENSIIGAGAVVYHDIPPNVIAAGNPIRIVKKLDPDRIIVRGTLLSKLGGN